MDGVRKVETGITVECLIAPRASISRVIGLHGGRIKIALAAPPVDGRANKELLRFVADLLGIPTRSVRLIRGDTAKLKVVVIQGVELDRVVQVLESAIHGG